MEKTVLVADDDRDIVRLITESLKFEQFKAIPAYSGKEALSILKENKIDFVVLDIMMPEMDGLEVCRNIRSEYSIPILSWRIGNSDHPLAWGTGKLSVVTEGFFV